jgi:serine/threonine protein kinase
MKIAAGTRLGPYEIEHAIGAGGMGVVYRADDSRLGRKVAIKVLPHARGEHFRRFEREARTIGALNHPNLLTLHDVGDHDGIPFLVTEMLDGESLRARLSRGPLRLREAIQIGAEVARGLAAAHDAGVIHRDVKPDNIFLTTEGRTKILDFGIAKLRRASVEMAAVTGDIDEDIAHSPTVTPTTADTGMVVGTPGYMAPEQLDAGAIDERTDIFALGVVLYEMIAGKRAFASDSAVEESYAILKTPADPPKGATKALARVVLRCLEKRPDARFQSAIDLAFALDELDASTDPVARISKISIEPDPRQSAVTIRDPAPTR